jgi:serine phosphatase RsbU (regulator of sigma subunit)
VSGRGNLDGVRQADLLARLWPVVDPALDVLPADELLARAVGALEQAFGAVAAAVVLTSGERLGTPEEDAAWSRGPRLELPLHDGRQEVGRLEIAMPDGLADEEERFALRLAATRLGRALARRRAERESARVQQRLRADARAVEHLYRIAGALMAQRGLEDVVQYVTDEATEIVAAQFGAFFYNVLDDAGGSYMLYTLSGVPREAFSRFPMPRNTDVFAPTFAGEGVVRSDDITGDPRYGRNAPRHGMPEGHLPVRSYLAVPVKARDGEVLGGLFFGHSAIGVFDAEAERVIVGVAALAALAIENARLHDTAQSELAASRRAYRERDMVARVLQESLLPASLPEIEGLDAAAAYAPGSAVVGGDFYDLFPVGGGAHVAAIGDVQGKDARAAARTSLVRHAVRLAAIHAAGPVEALQVVNGATLQDRDDEDPRFSTLLLARVERRPEGLHLQLASGGHPPALILRGDGVVESVDCPGTLLGVVEDPVFNQRMVSLRPGDAIVLYTDGLTEARRERGILGEARVKQLLAGLAGQDAQGIAGGLEKASLDWSQGHRADDLALLVLRAP